MNVIEDVRNRIKSKGVGMGAGSRRGMSNVVHPPVLLDAGSWPLLAKSYSALEWRDERVRTPIAYLVFLVFPIECHPLV